MDDYLEHFLCFSSWSDIDVKQRSSEICSQSGQPNGLLLSPVGVEENDNNNSYTSMINSNGSTESLAAQDASSVVLGSESDYGINIGLHSGETPLHENGQNFYRNPSNGMVNGSSEVTKLGCQYNMAVPMPPSLNIGSLKQNPLSGNISSSSLPYTEVEEIQGNNTLEQSVFESFDKDFRTLPSIPHLCPLPSSFEGVSSLPPGMGSDRIGGFGLQGGEYVDDLYAMESHSSNLFHSKGTHDLQNYPLSSFASGPQMKMTTAGLQSLSQATSTTPPGECNGTGKPRVRARRGQATDPHSIAERLRREKIAERMKSLQELLPNPNKTDKASMLDEIIEYVKFLQLQVKVLSMSRLGAAGAVVPLITDCQAEGGNGLLLSPSASQVADIVFPSDEIAFERELVKLMESNVTKAMQYLQTKGLCLMPVALASAMSFGKGKDSSSSSSSAPLPEDWPKKNGSGIHQLPSNGNAMLRNTTTESNKCIIGAAAETEDGKNISCSTRELKPKI